MKASLIVAIACCALSAAGVAGAQEAEKSCAVMIKGLPAPRSVGAFDRAEAAHFWTLVNNEVIDELGNYLVTAHRVTVLEIPHAEAPRTGQHVGRALAQRNCNRIMQLYWEADQDASGPYLAFTATIMRTEHVRRAEGGSIVETKGEYSRAYRLVRTPEALKGFKAEEFAGRIFEDMEKAGVLAPLRR